MLLLTATTDKIQVVTSATGDVDVHASYMEMSQANPPVVQGGTSGRNHVTITTAATTDIVAAPSAASITRNVKTIHIRNTHATVSNDILVQFNQGGTIYELFKVTLLPGDQLEYVEGVGFFKVAAAASTTGNSTNYATAASAAGFAADTYVTGTAIKLNGMGAPTVGRRYSFRLIISKTAAGTATPIVTVRVGTAGTTADTGILTFTWGAGTAAVDRGEIELEALFTAVGSGTSAILRGKANWTTNLAATGLSSNVHALQVNSSGFDSTNGSSIIGLSYNGGASAVHTIEWASAFTDQL